MVHRAAESWTQLKWRSTHAHTPKVASTKDKWSPQWCSPSTHRSTDGGAEASIHQPGGTVPSLSSTKQTLAMRSRKSGAEVWGWLLQGQLGFNGLSSDGLPNALYLMKNRYQSIAKKQKTTEYVRHIHKQHSLQINGLRLQSVVLY